MNTRASSPTEERDERSPLERLIDAATISDPGRPEARVLVRLDDLRTMLGWFYVGGSHSLAGADHLKVLRQLARETAAARWAQVAEASDGKL